MDERILCLGESLIDAVQRPGRAPVEHVGGSILNVACGLARLGHRTALGSWWGADERGQRIVAAVRDAGVRVEPGSDGAPRTSVARALLDEAGRASYTFDVEWAAPPLKDLDGVTHLHTGCFSATMEPGGTQVVETARRVRGHGTVSYDPNVRPSLMGTPADVLARVEELVGLADVVKASDEDLAWLYPDRPVEEALGHLARLGPHLVVVTRGAEGAWALVAASGTLVEVAPVAVEVADTVGAGDSFMAGLVSGLLDADLLGSAAAGERLAAATPDQLQPALRRASVASALTVSRHGAHGPSRAEVQAVV